MIIGLLLALRRDSVGTQYYAGGYAVSVIILLVAVLESFVARDRHFSKKQPSKGHVVVPEYMKEIYRYRGYKRLSELFVVRDSIIHSHVWLIKYALPKRGGRRFISATRKSWSGNDRLKQRLNPKTYRTKLLRFNAIPSRMDGTDVVKTFDVVFSALRFLEKKGANPVPLISIRVKHQGQYVPFESVPKTLANVLTRQMGSDH